MISQKQIEVGRKALCDLRRSMCAAVNNKIMDDLYYDQSPAVRDQAMTKLTKTQEDNCRNCKDCVAQAIAVIEAIEGIE